MSERFVVETVAVRDKVITDTEKCYSYEDLDEIVDKLNEQQDTLKKLKEENEQLIKEIKSKNKIIELYYEMVRLNE